MTSFWRLGSWSPFLILLVLTALVLPSAASAQDKMVGKDELIRQLGGQEPTVQTGAPAPGGMRLRGVAGVKSVDQTPPAPKEIALSIHFKYDSVELADEFSRQQVREAGLALSSSELCAFGFEIGGHTDAVGPDAYNMELSLRRAQAVKDALCRGYSVDCGKLQVKGYGKTRPVATNDDESGRAHNRRVVFKRLE